MRGPVRPRRSPSSTYPLRALYRTSWRHHNVSPRARVSEKKEHFIRRDDVCVSRTSRPDAARWKHRNAALSRATTITSRGVRGNRETPVDSPPTQMFSPLYHDRPVSTAEIVVYSTNTSCKGFTEPRGLQSSVPPVGHSGWRSFVMFGTNDHFVTREK